MRLLGITTEFAGFIIQSLAVYCVRLSQLIYRNWSICEQYSPSLPTKFHHSIAACRYDGPLHILTQPRQYVRGTCDRLEIFSNC